jgi:hypothetical protein
MLAHLVALAHGRIRRDAREFELVEEGATRDLKRFRAQDSRQTR